MAHQTLFCFFFRKPGMVAVAKKEQIHAGYFIFFFKCFKVFNQRLFKLALRHSINDILIRCSALVEEFNTLFAIGDIGDLITLFFKTFANGVGIAGKLNSINRKNNMFLSLIFLFFVEFCHLIFHRVFSAGWLFSTLIKLYLSIYKLAGDPRSMGKGMGKTGSSLQRLQGSSQMKGLLCLKSPLKKLKIPFFYAPSLTLLQRYGLRFVLFKQTPFVNHEIGGLDLLFGSPWEYERALNYLKRDGFVVYLSEKNEPYKTMVVKYDKTNDFLLVLHLQRKVAWCGLEALSAKEVLAHAKTYKGYSGLLLPCYEDILLIHAGHILFENYTIQPYEHHIFNKLKKRKLDQVYIQRQLEAYGWNTSFEKFMHMATQEHTLLFSF